MTAELDEVLDAAAGTVDAALDVARRNGNDLCYIATYQLQILRSALAQARVDREEVERLKRTLEWSDNYAAFLRLQAENEALAKGLDEALDVAANGWSYAGDCFRKKWNYEEDDRKLRALLAARTAAAKEGT